MTKTAKRSVLVIVVLAIGLLTAARGDIRQSHHDFGGAAWADNEICLPCHTPHHADLTVPQSPLWNHELSGAVYTPYASPSLDASPGQPGSVTKLCLSCHDGTVAMDNFGGRTGGTRFIGVRGRIGIDLRGHHPVSFAYDTALATADGELHDPGTTPSGLGGTIAEDMLFDGRLECSSCHDVHVSRNTAGCVGCHNVHGGNILNAKNTLSLRKSNVQSELCLTCHKK